MPSECPLQLKKTEALALGLSDKTGDASQIGISDNNESFFFFSINTSQI